MSRDSNGRWNLIGKVDELLSYLVNRLAIRARLLRLPLLAAKRGRSVTARRLAFAGANGLSGNARTALAAIAGAGVHVFSSLGALVPGGGALIDDLVAVGTDAWRWSPGCDLLESEDILHQQARVYLLGLHSGLLDFAEEYLEQPCFYLGCSLKRERVGLPDRSTRQWHRDIEDERMLRLVIYLNDVAAGGGPFEYIEEAGSAHAGLRLDYRAGYVGDAAMCTVVPAQTWRTVLGGAGLVVAFDGVRLFHRVAPPTIANRFSLSLTYSSRHPRQVLRQVRLRAASRRLLLSGLPERARASIPAARWS